MRFTKTNIEKLNYTGNGKNRMFIADETIKQLKLRISPDGKKVFVLRYYAPDGSRHLMTLGTFGEITVSQAIELAKRNLYEKALGNDPLSKRKTERSARKFSELSEAYLERHAKPKKKSWKKDESRINRHLLPKWGSRKVKSIKREEVSKLHDSIGKEAKYEANRTLELVKKMFNLAIQWGYVPEGFINPAVGIERFKEKPRDRWVKPEEMPKLAEAINRQKNIFVRSAFWLYLFTGLRKNELLKLKWTDVDFNRKEIRISDTKAGRTHYLPLSTQALTIIKSLLNNDSNPYILQGNRTGKPLVNIDKNWRKVRKEAGLEDVRLHDLRRTFGSWMATSGTSLLVIGRALNQTSQHVTSVYARLSEDPVREAVENHGNSLEKVVGIDTFKTKAV